MKIVAYWTVTERHSAEIEVDDDFDPDDVLSSSGLAEIEGGDTFDECSDRYLESWDVIETEAP